MGESEDQNDNNDKITTFDDLLEHLGTGRWSLLYLLITSVYNGCFSMQALSGGFMAPLMNQTCIPPDIQGSASIVQNSSSSSSYYHYILTTNNATTVTVLDECTYEIASRDGGSRVASCTQWDFDHADFGDTLTSQMSLVCERSFFVPLYQSVYMFGSAFGSSLGGLLSDKLGRRRVFVVSTIMLVLVGAGMTLFSNILLILVTRSALGFLHNAAMASSYVLGYGDDVLLVR